MKENVTIFTKSAIFYFSFWRIFGSFSNQMNSKSGHGTSDFNENQPKEGRKIFYFFNFVSWYQNHK